jgi:hypothetical protein
MKEILLFLANYCSFLFRPDRYRFVDSRVDESFGGDAFVVLESKTVRLRFTRDRDQLLFEFQPAGSTDNRSEWFSQGPLRGVLLGDRGGSEVLDEYWAQFLGESLGELEERFSNPESANELITALHDQERKRAKDLFG